VGRIFSRSDIEEIAKTSVRSLFFAVWIVGRLEEGACILIGKHVVEI
jgi:hypothetical protein